MKKQNYSSVKSAMIRILDWDFNPQVYQVAYLVPKQGMLIINPIMLSCLVSPDMVKKVIEANKHKGIDLLQNDSYPIFDADTGLMICGNRAVAHALVSSGCALLVEKKINYPIFYNF